MKALYLFFVISTMINISIAQTPKEVHLFPEDYVGKTITFKDIAYMPTLKELNGMYLIGIDIADASGNDFGFGSLDKITGAVERDIAKEMSKKGLGGYSQFYYGSVTGKVIKKQLTLTSEYVFVITKIVNHWLGQEDKPIEVFQSKNQ